MVTWAGVIVAGAVYRPVLEMLPEGAVGGLTELIDQLTVWFEVPLTVAANCCCWLAPKVTLEGVTLTFSEPVLPPKNTPLITALAPPVQVTLIFTCPEMFQTR